jgi:serine protease AprX
VYVRRLTRALPATLILALIWPASAAATPINADLDADKVTESLESHIDGLPDGREVRLIVSLDRAATGGRVRALERAVGDLDVHQRFDIVDAVAVTATKEQVRELAAEGVVDRVEQDLPVQGDAEDSFSSGMSNSAQASFGVTEARLDAPLFDGDGADDDNPDDYSYDRDDLVAAVIDSGIDADHVDLNGGKVLAFAECIREQGDPVEDFCETEEPYDNNGHGTHVASTLAGDGEGDSRYAGVAPGAALVGVKVLDANNDGWITDVVAGIEWAVEHKEEYGIEALNLSLGSEGCGDGLNADSNAVNAAWSAGLIVTVAAGNNGPETCTIGSPGDAKDVITVGAMSDVGSPGCPGGSGSLVGGLGFMLADFSGRGPTADARIKPDISAPGVGIVAAEANSGSAYTLKCGTSMATPFVTGVALLMKDAEPSLFADEVKETLRGTAVDWGRGDTNAIRGSRGPDADYGAGRLAAYAAIAAADALVDGTTTLSSPPPLPQHAIREGSLAGTGEVLEYSVDVPDLRFPVAATLIDVPTRCLPDDADPDSQPEMSNPNFSLRLTAPDGRIVATATSTARQDEFGYRPTAPGVYKLRVYSFRDCGDFFVDVSGGVVSAVGTANPDPDEPTDPAPGGTTPAPTPTPSRPAAPDDSAAFAAVANAARATVRRATSRVRRVGLRRLLRRGRFTFAGVTYGAGKVQLAIRMRHRGRNVLVARATRTVTRAGKPRLNVRLTRAGRRLLRRARRSARFTVRAAVTDTSKRRRFSDRAVRVRR